MAYNLITGSRNFTLNSVHNLIGSASWTGSATQNDLYVQGLVKTDIFYPVAGTSSLFIAKMNFSGSGEIYTYNYTGALSGSVTELQSGSYSDYYVDTWWGIPDDILYTYDPYVTRSIDVNGQWTDTEGGAWKAGHHFAFLKRRGDGKIVGMCAVYPVTNSLGESQVEYVSPGVNGFFCITIAGQTKKTNYTLSASYIGNPKRADLTLINGDVVIATTEDPPPSPEPEPSSIITIQRTAGFFFP